MLILVVMVKMMQFHLLHPDDICIRSQVAHIMDEIIADNSHHYPSQHHCDLNRLEKEVRRNHEEEHQWVDCANSDR